MKKVLVIFMTLFLILMFSTPTIASKQSTCEDALLSLMWEDIRKAIVEHHYDIKDIQSSDEKVLDLKMTNGLSFEITIQLNVFVGAHKTIGTDTLKFVREVPGGL